MNLKPFHLLFAATVVLVFTQLVVDVSGKPFIIQIAVVVDQKGFDKWKANTGKLTEQELKQEITAYMVEVGEIFKSLETFDPPLQIRFAISEFVVAQRVLESKVTGNRITSRAALAELVKYKKANLNKPDLVFLYTGYDLAGRAIGTAHRSQICSPDSAAIYELNGQFSDVIGTAHEIAHSLDSDHDGEGDGEACSPRGHVMNSVVAMDESRRYFSFSSCSYKSIYQKVVKWGYGKWCMHDANETDIVSGPRLGSLMTPDDICRRQFSKDDYVDREWYAKSSYSERDSMCVHLRCETDMAGIHAETPAGMMCGKNKQCIGGYCRETSGGDPNVSDTCPLGDQTNGAIDQDYNTMVCKNLTDEACFQHTARCCHKCSKVNFSKADKECRRLEGKRSALVREVYRQWGDQLCQGLFCAVDPYSYGYKGTFQYRAHTTPNGLNCGKSKQCHHGRCVQTDKGDPNMADWCPYGDQPWIPGAYQRTCAAAVQGWGCDTWKHACCRTCPP